MAEKVTVSVQEGKIRGTKKTSKFSATEYYSFFGVPYGQNTGGMARFKDPVKVKPWKNVLNAALENRSGCFQLSPQYNKIMGSEDCLYNNIHTPNIPKKGDPLKAVVVDIHPGGWFHGSPETWYYGSPDYVIHCDIVYVCIAYRLHMLGFLNLGLEHCSGNQGLKDIILSLQWIKENISVFGGDPNNITLMGNSSGSFNVHYLLLSPKAKGLFHKAVMMGGDVFNPVTITLDEAENALQAVQIAQQLGYKDDVNDKQKLLMFFKKNLTGSLVNLRIERRLSQVVGTPYPASPFRPTKDQGDNAVLPENCRELIGSMTKVPLLFGICEKEAVLGFTRGIKNAMMKNFVSGLRNNCNSWARDMTDEEAEFIKKKIEAFYWNGEPIETAPLSLLIDIQTDMVYSDVYPTLLNVITKDLPSSVYLYKFTFEGSANNSKKKFLSLLDEPIKGTIHAEDFCYWAYVPHPSNKNDEHLTPETIEMIHTFTKIISTFAKNGDPNNEHLKVHWNPSTNDKPCYMKIDKEMELIDGKFNGERMKFWADLKKELNRE